MGICNINDCSNKAHARRMCSAHIRRQRLGQDMEKPVQSHKFGENRGKNPLYSVHQAMRRRCYNPNSDHYKYYGARGIKVCDRWLGPSGFAHFAEDMGNKPEGMTIDRIDNDGDYTPDNCRWATRSTQQINQRINSVNTSGYKGVHYMKSIDRWVAYIDYKGKRTNIGSFKDKSDAVAARKDAEIERLQDLLSNKKG